MINRDEAIRSEILTRLAQTRQELRQLLEPPRENGHGSGMTGDHPDGFPRSRTMQMLMSGKGLGTLGAVAGGLLLSRPALALRLLRMLPAGAIARTLMLRAFTSWRSRRA